MELTPESANEHMNNMICELKHRMNYMSPKRRQLVLDIIACKKNLADNRFPQKVHIVVKTILEFINFCHCNRIIRCDDWDFMKKEDQVR